MAGHSKWANIQHRKGRQDSKRGKLFSKLIREINVAARIGGSDPSANSRLRAAIDNGYANNMAKDTIMRAISRGAGGTAGGDLEEIRYEGYGPEGIAVLVECMTDNRNRTVGEVRYIFSKYGGNLGTDGSVAYLFKKIGYIHYQSDVDEDQLTDLGLQYSAEDIVQNEDGSFVVITTQNNFFDIKGKLDKAGFESVDSGIVMRPDSLKTMKETEAESALKLLDALDDLDDVQNVYSNIEVIEE